MNNLNDTTSSGNEKMETFKKLLWEMIQKFPGSKELSYVTESASWKLLLEVIGCYLDCVPMNELPPVLLTNNPSDLATFRIHWIKNKAIEEMKTPVSGIPIFPEEPEYPEGFSQEIKIREPEPEEESDMKSKLVENIKKIKSLESELEEAKSIIETVSSERDQMAEQLTFFHAEVGEEDDVIDEAPEDKEMISGESELEEFETQISALEGELYETKITMEEFRKERDYWKFQFEELENAQRQHAAQNNKEVSKQYKISKLEPVDFLNNLIATEPYSMEQLAYIQYCLMQKIPVSIISKCVSAAFPVSFMEDYIKYYCKKSKHEYIEYTSPSKDH